MRRLLPPRWRGEGRRARWHRARARRVLSALLVAAAVLVGWQALAPSPTDTQRVPVLAHDLPAGHRLTPDDLTTAQWPAEVALPGLVTRTDAVGRVLTAPIGHGEPVTASRVRAARDWPGLSSHTILLGVPVTSAQLATAVRPGDHIDILERRTGEMLGSDLRVVRGPQDRATQTSLTGPAGSPDPQLLIACSPDQVREIARAMHSSTPGGGLVIALHASA